MRHCLPLHFYFRFHCCSHHLVSFGPFLIDEIAVTDSVFPLRGRGRQKWDANLLCRQFFSQELHENFLKKHSSTMHTARLQTVHASVATTRCL